jgi:hypothetical protein
MRRGRGAVRVPGMTKTAQTAAHDLTLWTEFLVAGKRVYIRTRRPLRVPRELRESAGEKGADPPTIEVRTVVPEAEP